MADTQTLSEPHHESVALEYKEPQKEINGFQDMNKWTKSQAYSEYNGFILALNQAVRGKSLLFECHISVVARNLLNMLEQMEVWITEIPPIDQAERFGNRAFRTYFSRLKENSNQLLETALPQQYHPAILELSSYLVESIGNYTRIDYGTGHEMSFAMFLYCLFKIKALVEEDYIAAVNEIFYSYLKVMRKLQITYRMEPAGSHGVWSLDDFQFLPFIWGSSQFVGHPHRIEPKDFPIEDVAEKMSKEFLFMSCIKFVNGVKTGPFAEHSNQLWNISGVTTWQKINTGLIKMYKEEVLGKFPVIQHVLFGSLLPINAPTT